MEANSAAWESQIAEKSIQNSKLGNIIDWRDKLVESKIPRDLNKVKNYTRIWLKYSDAKM